MERICLVSKNSNHSKIIKNTQNGFEFELNKKSFLKIFNQSLSINKFKKNLITKKARYTVKKLLNNNKKIENKLKVSFFQSHN